MNDYYNINNEEELNEIKRAKKRLFSFTKMNKYYSFPFIVPIVCYSTKFFLRPMSEFNHVKKIKQESIWSNFWEKGIESYVFFYTLIGNSSHIISGLLYFVSSIKSQGESENIEKVNNNEQTTQQANTFNSLEISIGPTKKEKNKRNLKLFGIVFLMSLILTLYTIIKGYALMATTIEKRIYFLFFISIFNIPILKIPIYNHRGLSLAIASLGLGFLILAYIFANKYYCIDIDILLFVGSIFYSLYLVLVKYLTQNMGISPFQCLLLIGVISSLMDVIGFGIFSILKNGNLLILYESMIKTFKEMLLYSIGYFIDMTILQVFIILTVYYFSPAVFALSDIISPLLSWIQNCIERGSDIKEGRKTIYYTMNTLGYLIVLLSALIYNELIICHFFGLDKYTKNSIEERGKNEYDEDYKNKKSLNHSDLPEIDDYIVDNVNESYNVGRNSRLTRKSKELKEFIKKN